MIRTYLIAFILVPLSTQLLAGTEESTHQSQYQSEKHAFSVERIASLEDPWGMAFASNGDILLTQKSGDLRIIRDGNLLTSPIAGLPDMEVKGQGGLMDIAFDPDYENNQQIFLSYVGSEGRKYGTEVLKARLENDRLIDIEVIFKAWPKSRGGRHFGARLAFAADDMLFISLGDRGHRPNGQDLSTHAGSLIRIKTNGSIPTDNPFVGQSSALDEIYTYGNRNMQGMAVHPATLNLWTHEHGPQGGDELNLMEAGKNYGWAEITYGVNYGLGTKIGEGVQRDDVTPPVHYWVPSIAPSGMAFYTADRFPKWQNNLFVGSLKFQQLVRLELDGNKVVNEERIPMEDYGRVRDVRQGPDGYLYLLIEGRKGGLLRIIPADS